MEIKLFNELSQEKVQFIADANYNYWKNFNPALIYKESTGAILEMRNNKTSLPIGIALVENDKILGFCTLRENRLLKYPQYNPWICNVMIFEKGRGKGLGKQMIDKASEKLKELGFTEAYAWTDQVPDFYKKLGFTYMHEIEKNEGGTGHLFYKKF